MRPTDAFPVQLTGSSWAGVFFLISDDVPKQQCTEKDAKRSAAEQTEDKDPKWEASKKKSLGPPGGDFGVYFVFA